MDQENNNKIAVVDSGGAASPAAKSMAAERVQTAAAQALEIVITLLIVLAFFSIFLWLLNKLFPTGVSLQQLTQDGGINPVISRSQQITRDIMLAHGQDTADMATPGILTAVLKETRKKVKSKRASAIAWKPAHVDMPLYDRDAIQTFNNSSASIEFDKQNYLDMGENSLVIIKRLEKDPLLKEKRSFMVMVDGELRGRISSAGDESVLVEITTPTTVASIRSRNSLDGTSDFKVSVNPDKSSTITVYQGVAEVISEGKTIRIESNQGLTVDKEGKAVAPVELPNPPVLTEPLYASVFNYRDLPPKINFSWAHPDAISDYRFVLAKDPDFRQQILEEPISKIDFSHGNLKAGLYYWRVSAVSGEFEGLYSETWRFRVLQDKKAPILNVKFPPETITKSRYTIKGKTEPDARVFIGGKHIKIAYNGAFSHRLSLKRGINIIVVEAIDSAGNVAYRSQLVRGKF